jgi:4-hydroxythreonine-4-phosphate dehydrogenase
MTATTERPIRLGVTSGEPAGIGPDICLDLAQKHYSAELVILGDPTLLASRAGKRAPLPQYDPALPPVAGHVSVLPVPLAEPVEAGRLNPGNARYVLAMLERAVAGCRDGEFAAMVTAPVHKGVINDAGIAFSGHTEFLAQQTGASLPVMMLTAGSLRVALATTHLPLSAVPAAITHQHLTQILTILEGDLRARFLIQKPRILVCGLNPHAGEAGHLGHEEIEVIEPCLAALRKRGLDLVGPLPADTLFTPAHLDGADAVLAMYHDQGLPVLKHVGFGRAINITLGLPIVRTSVDHGTALELAGTGRADDGSLNAAVEAALTLIAAN